MNTEKTSAAPLFIGIGALVLIVGGLTWSLLPDNGNSVDQESVESAQTRQPEAGPSAKPKPGFRREAQAGENDAAEKKPVTEEELLQPRGEVRTVRNERQAQAARKKAAANQNAGSPSTPDPRAIFEQSGLTSFDRSHTSAAPAGDPLHAAQTGAPIHVSASPLIPVRIRAEDVPPMEPDAPIERQRAEHLVGKNPEGLGQQDPVTTFDPEAEDPLAALDEPDTPETEDPGMQELPPRPLGPKHQELKDARDLDPSAEPVGGVAEPSYAPGEKPEPIQ